MNRKHLYQPQSNYSNSERVRVVVGFCVESQSDSVHESIPTGTPSDGIICHIEQKPAKQNPAVGTYPTATRAASAPLGDWKPTSFQASSI